MPFDEPDGYGYYPQLDARELLCVVLRFVQYKSGAQVTVADGNPFNNKSSNRTAAVAPYLVQTIRDGETVQLG